MSYLYTATMLITSVAALYVVLITIFRTLSGHSLQIIVRLFILGFLYYTLQLGWILTAYPLQEFFISGWKAILILSSFYIITCIGAGLSFLIFAPIYSLRQTSIEIPYLYLLFIVLSGFLGYAKAFLLWIIYFSTNVSFGMYWIFGSPALSIALTPLARLYSYIGISGTDALIGGLVVSLFWYTQKGRVWFRFASLISLLIISFIISTSVFIDYQGTATLDVPLDNDTYALVIATQSNLKTNKDRSQQIDDTLSVINISQYAIIVVPEGSGISSSTTMLLASTSAPYIFSKAVYNNENLESTIFVNNPQNGASVITTKRFLVPFGEYMPIIFSALGGLMIGSRDIERVGMVRNFHAGTGVAYTNFGSEFIGFGLCSDLWSQEGIWVSQKHQGATIFILQSNTLFHGNRWFLTNLYAWHRAHAYSSQTRVVSVPNDSPIWVVDGRK